MTKTSLQSRCPSPIPTFFEDANLLLYSPMSQEDVRWNWEKASRNKLQNYYRKTPFKLYARVTSSQSKKKLCNFYPTGSHNNFLFRSCLTRTDSRSDVTHLWWSPSRSRRTLSAFLPSRTTLELCVFSRPYEVRVQSAGGPGWKRVSRLILCMGWVTWRYWTKKYTF